MHVLWKVPWILPVVMTVWNVVFSIATFFIEGRVKLTPMKFAVLYAGTIRPAMAGDMTPFVTVFSLPG